MAAEPLGACAVRADVRRWILWIGLIAGILIGGVALAAGGYAAIHNQATFGTFYTTGAPPRIDWCGRRYYSGVTEETLAEIHAFLAKNGLSGLTQVDSTPSGLPVVANVMSPAQRAANRTNICTMELWVEVGADRYRIYGLSGGP